MTKYLFIYFCDYFQLKSRQAIKEISTQFYSSRFDLEQPNTLHQPTKSVWYIIEHWDFIESILDKKIITL